MVSLVLKTVLELDVLKGTVLDMSDFTSFFNDNSLVGVLATSSRMLQALDFQVFSVAKKEVCGFCGWLQVKLPEPCMCLCVCVCVCL